MSRISACIFDLDGVIVDTAKYHYIAWKKLANDLGFDFSEQENEQLKGISRMASLDILLKIGKIKLSDQEKEILATQKNDYYLSFIKEIGPEEILPGAKDFLIAAKSEGLKIALGSASKNAMLILQRLELVDCFDVIIDGTKVFKAKPDPEVFLRGAQELGVNPDNCVVFEDAESGVEAAIKGGMKVIGIGDSKILHKSNLVVSGLHEMALSKLQAL